MEGAWFVSIMVLVICCFFSMFIASEKNRSVLAWCFMGLIFGPLGLMTIAGLPVKTRDNNEEEDFNRKSPWPQTMPNLIKVQNVNGDCLDTADGSTDTAVDDDTSAKTICLACNEIIPPEIDACPKCGWSYNG